MYGKKGGRSVCRNTHPVYMSPTCTYYLLIFGILCVIMEVGICPVLIGMYKPRGRDHVVPYQMLI